MWNLIDYIMYVYMCAANETATYDKIYVLHSEIQHNIAVPRNKVLMLSWE